MMKKSVVTSRLTLGTVHFGMDYGFMKAKTQDEVDAILSSAYEHGITCLDTAREYGSSEEKIGAFLKNHPDKPFVVATKLSKLTPDEWHDGNQLKQAINDSVECSLVNLGLESLAILQLHQCEEELIARSEFWDIINDLKAQGKIEAFGVSVYTPSDLEHLLKYAKGTINWVQCPFNVFDRRFEKYFKQLRENDIQIMSRSTFLKGIMVQEVVPEELEGLKSFHEKLRSLAQQNNTGSSQLALAFALGNEYITTTIIGVNSVEELDMNMKRINLTEDIEGVINTLAVDDEMLIDPRQWRTV